MDETQKAAGLENRAERPQGGASGAISRGISEGTKAERDTIQTKIDILSNQCDDISDYIRDALYVKLEPVREQAPQEAAGAKSPLKEPSVTYMSQLSELSNRLAGIRSLLSNLVGELEI